jgi:hypothetical protein
MSPADYVTVERVRLSATEALDGHHRLELVWQNAADGRRQSDAFILSGLAGLVAELRVNPGASRSPSDDELTKAAWERFIHAGDFDDYVRLKNAEAAALVETHWASIQAFAAEMLDRETIHGPDCEALFHRICGHTPAEIEKATA